MLTEEQQVILAKIEVDLERRQPLLLWVPSLGDKRFKIQPNTMGPCIHRFCPQCSDSKKLRKYEEERMAGFITKFGHDEMRAESDCIHKDGCFECYFNRHWAKWGLPNLRHDIREGDPDRRF